MIQKVKEIVLIVLMVVGIVTLGAMAWNNVVSTAVLASNHTAEQQMAAVKQQVQIITSMITDLKALEDEKVTEVLNKYVK